MTYDALDLAIPALLGVAVLAVVAWCISQPAPEPPRIQVCNVCCGGAR